jgi:hypothetical protein
MGWLATLWVMAMAFHHTDSHPRSVVGILLLALPVLAWPTSAPLVGAFVALSVAITAGALPEAANHTVLIMSARGSGSPSRRWSRPPARAPTLVTGVRSSSAGSTRRARPRGCRCWWCTASPSSTS